MANILIVDDLRSMRLTLGGVMEDEQHNVVVVENGYQAIEAVGSAHFDAVFMDIKMPGIDGVETFREVKKLDSGVAVIMMTGYSVEDLIEAALKEGAYTCLHKPFDMEKAIGIIDSIVGEKV